MIFLKKAKLRAGHKYTMSGFYVNRIVFHILANIIKYGGGWDPKSGLTSSTVVLHEFFCHFIFFYFLIPLI